MIKKTIKKILKKNKKLNNSRRTIIKVKLQTNSYYKAGIFAVKELLFGFNKKNNIKAGEQYKRLFEKLKINIQLDENRFIFPFDEYKILSPDNNFIENTTVPYNFILINSLNDIRKNANELKESNYKNNEIQTIDAVENYIDKIIKILQKSKKKNKKELITIFNNIKDHKAEHFEESLQRILFFNSLLWQTGHALNGLGRLDKILEPYFEKDINENIITLDEARRLIDDFFYSLHSYYNFKSSEMLGDTGQIIILGGKNEDETYNCNKLTYLFIEEGKKLQLPDPKILLRVSNKMPRDLIKLSIDCIKTGVGYPLFANDDVIIPKLIDFGYDKSESYNYITSACWEPLIQDLSLEQNNMNTLVFMKPFNEMFDKENVSEFKSIDLIIEIYKQYLENYLNDFMADLDKKIYDIDPIMSMFIENCSKTSRDISEGGAFYNNYGVTTVSLANVVNSLINIEYFVFKEKKYTLVELNDLRKNNFENNEKIINELKNQKIRFGIDDKKVYDLANTIMSYTNDILRKNKNKWGGYIKIGFSAPSYIIEAEKNEASFDGRKNGEPFIVHISSDIPALPYTELVNFASKLDYSGNRFNGNVVDFMVSPSFIEKNEEKFVDFIVSSIIIGFFEMQMNAVSSETLIKAKAHPSEFPNLIVRVWGFSAYFNDLPESYKDVLIERALKSEGKC